MIRFLTLISTQNLKFYEETIQIFSGVFMRNQRVDFRQQSKFT